MKILIAFALVFSASFAHAANIVCSNPSQSIKITSSAPDDALTSVEIDTTHTFTVTVNGVTKQSTLMAADFIASAAHTAYQMYYVSIYQSPTNQSASSLVSDFVLCTDLNY